MKSPEDAIAAGSKPFPWSCTRLDFLPVDDVLEVLRAIQDDNQTNHAVNESRIASAKNRIMLYNGLIQNQPDSPNVPYWKARVAKAQQEVAAYEAQNMVYSDRIATTTMAIVAYSKPMPPLPG